MKNVIVTAACVMAALLAASCSGTSSRVQGEAPPKTAEECYDEFRKKLDSLAKSMYGESSSKDYPHLTVSAAPSLQRVMSSIAPSSQYYWRHDPKIKFRSDFCETQPDIREVDLIWTIRGPRFNADWGGEPRFNESYFHGGTIGELGVGEGTHLRPELHVTFDTSYKWLERRDDIKIRRPISAGPPAEPYKVELLGVGVFDRIMPERVSLEDSNIRVFIEDFGAGLRSFMLNNESRAGSINTISYAIISKNKSLNVLSVVFEIDSVRLTYDFRDSGGKRLLPFSNEEFAERFWEDIPRVDVALASVERLDRKFNVAMEVVYEINGEGYRLIDNWAVSNEETMPPATLSALKAVGLR